MSTNMWQKFMNGDDKAFAELYRHYFNELFAYGLKIGFNEEVCKDAIQDVFYMLITNRSRLSHVQNIEFYLLQSLKNRLYDLHQSRKKLNPLDYDDVILENDQNVVDAIIEKETQLNLENKLKKSLSILPPKQRKIIFWHYHLNLSFVEIAVLLDSKPDTIRKSIYRALQKMKEHTLIKAIPLVISTILLTRIG